MKSLLSIILAWVIPGGGHWYLGYKGKALLYLVLILGTFVAGMMIADFRNISLDRHPIFFLGAYIWNGGATVVAWLLTEGKPITRQLDRLDVGCLYCAVAGLLNILIMIDAYLLSSGYVTNVDH